MSSPTRTALIHIETRALHNDYFRDAQSRLFEAIELARAIELDVCFERIINLKKMSAGYLIGQGHIEEIASVKEETDFELLIVNHSLTPVQQRNLERILKVKVIDRTGLILEIFGERAATREGRLQVDAAALKYQKSRLVRSWTHLERQRGGSGFMGGPGETQIEADRRALDTQIRAMEARLEEVRKTRELQRHNRQRNAIPVVALVGYTNAGKSTLFNYLSTANVLAKDMLFATLDPVMRKFELPSGRNIILSDTVGFISNLPTELVAAFRATLEETIYADLILHVRDASHPEQAAQANDVWQVLDYLGISRENPNPPVIDVLNKIDLIEDEEWLHDQYQSVRISALTGQGLDELFEAVENILSLKSQIIDIHLDFSKGAARAWLHAHHLVIEESIEDTGYALTVKWNKEEKNRFKKQFGKI